MDPQKSFAGTDLGVLIGAPVFTLPAWFLPERAWPPLARLLSPMAIGDLTQNPATTRVTIRKTLGSRLAEVPAERILRDMGAEGVFTFFQVLKCYRPGGWEPAVRVAGFEHVHAALSLGRGAVLWVSHAFHGHLGAKVGFRSAGLNVVHLSTPAHGFSTTKFGIRYLNRVQTRIEDRYIAERVMLPLPGQKSGGRNAALQTLAKRLKANKVVSITGQRGTGRTVDARFLDGLLPLAPGAPSLAQLTGAKLLPVFAFRAADGAIEVTVEPEIELPGAREEAVARAVQAFAARSEPYVLKYPGQWLSWVQL